MSFRAATLFHTTFNEPILDKIITGKKPDEIKSLVDCVKRSIVADDKATIDFVTKYHQDIIDQIKLGAENSAKHFVEACFNML